MFILLPVGVNYQTNRLPIVTFSLIAINVLVYLISLFFELNGGEDAEYWIIENLWLIPAASSWPAYLTTMFVHAGFFHLIGNMLYLFLFGACVEDVVGRWKFLVFYLLGGLAAVFGHIAATPDHFASEIPLGGASGAVTACIAGFLILFSRLEIEFRYFGFFFFRVFAGEFSLAAWIVISFWFAKDLLFATLDFTSRHSGGGVAFAAHVGGFLAGLALIGIYRLLPKPADSEPDETIPAPGPPAQTRGMSTARFNAPAPAETPTVFISEGGLESGPFTHEQVRQMLALGSVSSDAYYWREGMIEWATVQDFWE
jgi:membrane associated rhomboid family serine protease